MDNKENKERFEKIVNEIIKPIMDKVYEVTFHYIETYKGTDDEAIKIPVGIKDDIVEKLDEVISYLKDQAGYYDGASLIGFALGRDGSRPGKKYKQMAAIAQAIRDLVSAKDDQIKDELEYMSKQQENARMASNLGF